MSRQRPVKDQGEQALKSTILDELETAAQARIKTNGRIALAPKLKLDWTHKKEGFTYMWASDSESYPVNLQQMFDSGYTMVRHEAGSHKGTPVTMNSKGCNLYLVHIPTEMFLEDEKIKQEKSNRNYRDIQNVGSREYAGESKELGQGTVAKHKYEENPDAISLMEDI